MRSNKLRHPMINKLLLQHHKLTTEGKNTVKYGWLAGHAGIRGNDLADTAAKNGTTLDQIAQVRIPGLDFKRQIYEYTNQKWQSMWDLKVNNKLHDV